MSGSPVPGGRLRLSGWLRVSGRLRLRRLLVPGLLVILLVVAGGSAVANPLLQDDGSRPESRSDSRREPSASGGIYDGAVPGFVREWSRVLQGGIASLSRDVRAGNWGAGVLAFLLSVVFGMVHIAGPGHGKVFAISYFSGRDARVRDGIGYSAVVNVVDSLSALAVVLLGYVLLRAILPSFREAGPRVLQLVSYGLIVIFGVIHLVGHLRPGRAGHDHGAAHERPARDGTAPGDGQAVGHSQGTRSPTWLLALSVGLIPCPVSTILLVYGLANGVLLFMGLMVLGVSLGGFVVMSGIAAGVMTGRSRLLALMSDGRAARLSQWLEYAASGLIIAVGVILFLAQF